MYKYGTKKTVIKQDIRIFSCSFFLVVSCNLHLYLLQFSCICSAFRTYIAPSCFYLIKLYTMLLSLSNISVMSSSSSSTSLTFFSSFLQHHKLRQRHTNSTYSNTLLLYFIAPFRHAGLFSKEILITYPNILSQT